MSTLSSVPSLGRLHGLVDRVFAAAMPVGRLYEDGFGDIDELQARVAAIRDYEVGVSSEIDRVRWGPVHVQRGVAIRSGRFVSPAASYLPPESREGVLELRLPEGAGPRPPVCLMLAATAEEGFLRRRIFTEPLVRKGVGVLLLENPFYGSRRPARQVAAVLRTVEDQFAMNLATVEEARALLLYLHREGYEHIGVSGYSQGGIMAAFGAALTPFPVRVVPRGAGAAAEPIFCHHALSKAMRWDRLADEAGSLEAAQKLFAECLDPVRVDRFSPPVDPTLAILVSARRDGFVPAEEAERLHAHWAGSELRWLEAGHVTSAVLHYARHRRAILDAFHGI